MRDDVPAWPPGASRSIRSVVQSLGRAVDGGGEARGPAADDRDVVGGVARRGLQSELLRQLAQRRRHQALAVAQDHDRETVARTRRLDFAAPTAAWDRASGT